MIIVDTTVLAYALGGDHPLATPCRALVEAIGRGQVEATTTVEVIQEFVHVRARRRRRRDAAQLGRDYASLLAPLLVADTADLDEGLRLFERHQTLGPFDAVLAAVTLRSGAAALVSAARGFRAVLGSQHVDPATPGLNGLLG